jgi:hypothetical protein
MTPKRVTPQQARYLSIYVQQHQKPKCTIVHMPPPLLANCKPGPGLSEALMILTLTLTLTLTIAITIPWTTIHSLRTLPFPSISLSILILSSSHVSRRRRSTTVIETGGAETFHPLSGDTADGVVTRRVFRTWA